MITEIKGCDLPLEANMVRKIVKDESVLKQKSEDFVVGQDDYLITDMIDTANAHKDNCAGLACVQIGIAKRIVLVRVGDNFIPFINPVIIKKSPKTYMAKEGCLSLDGAKIVKRHNSVMLVYANIDGKRIVKEFSGRTAQIIQHEVDHCNGILI